MSKTYRRIRFIGYVLPTTPADLVPIGNPSTPGMAVAGNYLADDDVETDIRQRIAILKNAVDTARDRLPPDEADVINVFVAPEFFYHGPRGPYIYRHPAEDPVVALRKQLAETFAPADYPNWTFLCGTAVTTRVDAIETVLDSDPVRTRNSVVENLARQWEAAFGPLKNVIYDMLINFIQNCHAYPSCEVRNRVVIVSNIPVQTPDAGEPTRLMTSEKYYVSNEDFLLYETSGKRVITEQMTAYPFIDLSAGDAKRSDFDEYAIFRQNGIDTGHGSGQAFMDYGVEICLDHSDTRLRRNIDNEPESIDGIHVQLIPSCGMQIMLPNVAAARHGFVFNCDGQSALGDAPRGRAVIDGVNCLYASYVDVSQPKYAAHSQLARVAEPAKGGDPNAPQATNATFETLNPDDITVLPVEALASLDCHFAGGPGEVHIYGLGEPYELFL